jgi:hypothetical protein
MPAWDAVERHAIRIAAPPDRVHAALRSFDFSRLRLLRLLLALRALPSRLVPRRIPYRPSGKVTLDSLAGVGFGLLAEQPGRALLFGVTGRFWRPVGNIEPFTPASFAGPVAPGYARAVWSFVVTADGADTVLTTETRVLCGDAASRLKFRLYWLFVRPGSGLIRRLMLRAIRRACQAGKPP